MSGLKSEYFEYFLSKLLSKKGLELKNDLSILKVQKLLFFTVAIDSGIGKENVLVKNVFNNFVAMPYGHVESDLYSKIRANSLNYYSVTSSQTILKENVNVDFSNLDQDIKSIIDSALDNLLEKNKTLLFETPFNLVELSHQYKSWKKNFHEAKKNGINSMPIPIEEIIVEEKYFHINQLELF